MPNMRPVPNTTNAVMTEGAYLIDGVANEAGRRFQHLTIHGWSSMEHEERLRGEEESGEGRYSRGQWKGCNMAEADTCRGSAKSVNGSGVAMLFKRELEGGKQEAEGRHITEWVEAGKMQTRSTTWW